jgi:ribonucleoside-triphosphate reductase
MKTIIKRDGRVQKFDRNKIIDAVLAAFKDVDNGSVDDYAIEKAGNIADYISDIAEEKTLTIEEIQDYVEKGLMSTKRKDVAKSYILFREKRNKKRKNTIDDTINEIVDSSNDYYLHENSNKDAMLATTQRDYVAGEVSVDVTKRFLLPQEIVDAHEKGILHFHDADYFIQRIYNCCLINLEDMLQNGTVISKTKIDKPHKFSTACNIATQIIAQVASSQYGGQSVSLAHLSPFVEESRKKFRKDYPELSEDTIEKMVLNDVRAGVQTLQYQIVTLMTTNGQAPFITVYMNLVEVEEGRDRDDLALVIEEVLKQRIQGVKNEKGVYITPAFPKLIYALDDINIHKDSKYWYLTHLAAQCTAKRMVPDYISNKIEKEIKEGDLYPCMGCRSFLTVDRMKKNYANALNYDKNKGKYYGRFNQGVVTINLVDVACSSNGDFDEFWKLLEERLELCHTALKCRHDRLLNTSSQIAPILWQHGAIARLSKDDNINELLYHGYSTISLGYAGLYEMTYRMLGKSHTTEEGKSFALSVMRYLNDKCEQWKAAEDIDYSVYGTPLESTTYKFAKCLKKRFGIIENVTDHDYITNSYHVCVREKIDAFKKLKLESEFQKLSPGGAISYIEVPDMQNNIEAIESVLQFIYGNIMYAEINTKSDYCQCCGYTGQIMIEEDDNHKLYWRCPNCGNTDTNKMNVARRTCGYIGTNFWNQGRTEEIRDRVLHL